MRTLILFFLSEMLPLVSILCKKVANDYKFELEHSIRWDILVRKIKILILTMTLLVKLMQTVEKSDHCLVKFLVKVVFESTWSIAKIKQNKWIAYVQVHLQWKLLRLVFQWLDEWIVAVGNNLVAFKGESNLIGKRVEEQGTLAPAGVYLVPLNLCIRQTAHAKAVDGSKFTAVPVIG